MLHVIVGLITRRSLSVQFFNVIGLILCAQCVPSGFH